MKYLFIILLFSCTKRFQPINNYILLDFDGHTENSYTYNPSGLTPWQISQVIIEVRKDFIPFRVIVGTDENEFYKYQVRQRVIVTDTTFFSSKYGGHAFQNSMVDGSYKSAFVYTYNLHYNTHDVAGAISHELGHTLGLEHHTIIPSIMGDSFRHPGATWVSGINLKGQQQNDIEIIKNALR